MPVPTYPSDEPIEREDNPDDTIDEIIDRIIDGLS